MSGNGRTFKRNGLRILHLTPFLWSGAGGVITRLCMSQEDSHTVAVVTSGQSKGFENWPSFASQLAEAGIRHYEIDLFDRSAETFWNSVHRMADTIREYQPDVIHCHSGVPACVAATARSLTRFPTGLVGHFHSWGLNRPEWMNQMDLWGFAQCDRLVVGAKATERILINGGIDRRRITYLPWGLPLDEILSAAGPTLDPPRARTLGFVGRVEPRKGQLDLVQTFRALRNQNPETQLRLVGPVADAAYARDVQRLIRKDGLHRSVSMPGRIDNVYEEMRSWSLFVSMSQDEGQGLAVLEAMALGVPVAARPVPGIEDYLRDGVNGIAVPSNPDRAAVVIEKALQDTAGLRQMAQRASRMVQKRYNWNRNVERIDEVYAAL